MYENDTESVHEEEVLVSDNEESDYEVSDIESETSDKNESSVKPFDGNAGTRGLKKLQTKVMYTNTLVIEEDFFPENIL